MNLAWHSHHLSFNWLGRHRMRRLTWFSALDFSLVSLSVHLRIKVDWCPIVGTRSLLLNLLLCLELLNSTVPLVRNLQIDEPLKTFQWHRQLLVLFREGVTTFTDYSRREFVVLVVLCWKDLSWSPIWVCCCNIYSDFSSMRGLAAATSYWASS